MQCFPNCMCICVWVLCTLLVCREARGWRAQCSVEDYPITTKPQWQRPYCLLLAKWGHRRDLSTNPTQPTSFLSSCLASNDTLMHTTTLYIPLTVINSQTDEQFPGFNNIVRRNHRKKVSHFTLSLMSYTFLIWHISGPEDCSNRQTTKMSSARFRLLVNVAVS